MKKLVALFVAALILSGCGGGSDKATTAAAAENQAESQAEETKEDGAKADASASGYVFQVNGTEIAMHADAEPVLAALGDAKNYFESASCAFEGMDKEYTYNGFIVRTYPQGDKDCIASVDLLDDTVETAEGIAIGSSLQDVAAAYGPVEAGAKSVHYGEGSDMELIILFENDTVASIQYMAVTE